MNNHPQGRNFFFILFLLVTILCVLIYRPFFIEIVLGASLAVVFYPIYFWIKRKIAFDKSWLAALITTISFIVVIGVPLFFIGSQVVKEAQGIYYSLSQGGGASKYIDSINTGLSNLLPDIGNFDLKASVGQVLTSFTGSISSIFASTLHTLLSFFLILISFFYFLKDGNRWVKYLVKISPLADKDDNKIVKMLDNAISGIMEGYLFIAMLQGSLLTIGLWIFGVPNPVLWGVLAGMASVIPTVGTTIVAGPAVIYLWVSGSTEAAIGLAIWSSTLVGMIDNLLNPIVLGKKVSLPPLVILFAVLGGVTLIGPAGIIIGPLSVSLLYTLLLIYRKNFEEK
jgi:predicted PurR-regulated permease PerM